MKKSFGFNLIEMAMVLVIVALLMSSILIPLPRQIEQKKIVATQQHLEEIKEALLGFAVLHERLPFPAESFKEEEENKVKESPELSSMQFITEGYLPWINLGVGRYDAWGNSFRYRSGFLFGGGFSLGQKYALVKDAHSGAILFQIKREEWEEQKQILSAIIFSTGKNAEGDKETCNRFSLDTTDLTDFIYCQGDYVENNFDDILIWLPKNIVVNRLVTVGKWPIEWPEPEY